MITEARIREAKKQLRKGFPEGEIKESLKREGYSQEDINLVFTPHKYDMRAWYLTSSIILFMFGFWFFLTNGGILVMVFLGLLFLAYLREQKRLKGNSPQ